MKHTITGMTVDRIGRWLFHFLLHFEANIEKNIANMPYLANHRYVDDPSKQYRQDLFNSAQFKDIVKRNKIREAAYLLEGIIAYVIANVGTTFSATAFAKF